ncbi:MAG: hypothetical protein LBB76_09115 [Azoarcus sp.]|jgi:hypothetical protein|nr:hypothetical protein [Azoarcus sp.]
MIEQSDGNTEAEVNADDNSPAFFPAGGLQRYWPRFSSWQYSPAVSKEFFGGFVFPKTAIYLFSGCGATRQDRSVVRQHRQHRCDKAGLGEARRL